MWSRPEGGATLGSGPGYRPAASRARALCAFVRAVEFAPRTRPGRLTVPEHLELSPDRVREACAEYVATVSGRAGAGLTPVGTVS